MISTTFFLACSLLIWTTWASTSDISGPAESFLHRKSGKDQDLELAGYGEAGYDSLISMDDDDDHDDMYSEELSFTWNDPEESSIESRACSHKCDKKCYYPLTHQCCNGLLLNGFWTCSKCVFPSDNVCAGRCYPKGFKCSFDKVIPDAWQHCPHHCKGRCFDAQKKKCCYNRIIPRSKVCCKSGQYCGNNCYNPTKSSCCNGQAIDKGAQCCTSKCGKMCYDKAKMKCCHKKIIAISSPCCTPAQRRCGNTCYSPNRNKCCLGKVTPKRYRTCGHTCYDPSVNRCCQNKRVIPKSRPCGCTRCGGVCINTGSHRCCHRRVLPKNVPCISGSGHPLRITSGLIARRVGCFRDTWNRAIPSLEGQSHLLTPRHYQERRYAIEKCALAAAKRGWSVFAVQHQGWCASSPIAGRTFSKYGRSNTCRNGKGGPWGNDVYVLQGSASKKTTSGDICVFPFIYRGKTYNACTNVNRNKPWCAVTPNYDVDGLWGYC